MREMTGSSRSKTRVKKSKPSTKHAGVCAKSNRIQLLIVCGVLCLTHFHPRSRDLFGNTRSTLWQLHLENCNLSAQARAKLMLASKTHNEVFNVLFLFFAHLPKVWPGGCQSVSFLFNSSSFCRRASLGHKGPPILFVKRTSSYNLTLGYGPLYEQSACVKHGFNRPKASCLCLIKPPQRLTKGAILVLAENSFEQRLWKPPA